MPASLRPVAPDSLLVEPVEVPAEEPGYSMLGESEAAAIRNEIKVSYAAIESVEQRIRELESESISREERDKKALRLTEQLQHHNDHIFALKARIAPIRHVPVEILCTIFLYAATARSKLFSTDSHLNGTTYSVTIRCTNGAWPLAHVCRRWREIAINYAPLWSTIGLDLSTLPKPEHARNILAMYLQRSRDSPLEIVLRPGSSTSFSDGEQFLALLFSSSTRWQTACIELTTYSQTFLLAKCFALFKSATFPILEKLITTEESISGLWGKELTTKYFPRLQNLTVSPVYQQLFLALNPSITTLKLVGSGNVVITHVATDNLHTLSLFGSVTLSVVPRTVSHIILPSLRKATFESPVSLDNLTLPSLQDLTLGNPKHETASTSVVDIFRRFLERSSCKIETFHVEGGFIQLDLVLEQLTSLRHLDLAEWLAFSNNEIVTSLQYRLSPALEILSIPLWRKGTVQLLEAVEARAGLSAPSLQVNAYHRERLDKVVNDRIQAIRANGAKVQLIRL